MLPLNKHLPLAELVCACCFVSLGASLKNGSFRAADCKAKSIGSIGYSERLCRSAVNAKKGAQLTKHQLTKKGAQVTPKSTKYV